MLPMIAAATSALPGSVSAVSRALLRVGHAAALVAALVLSAPGMAHAETGAPLPQGYTNDIPAAQPGAPSLKVQPVSDTDEESDEFVDTDPSALTDFQEPLAPYGVWIEDGTYGTVWVPDVTVVGGDFAPYQSSGHWALDDNGDWMWVSDYEWGYIPFHYGRWVWIGGRGWAWIPGRTYAPAWVTWRVGDAGYIGWAPLPPAWYWSGGIAVGLWTTPYAAYCFVPSTYVFHEHVYTYVVRNEATVRQAAAGTRPYKAAKPSVNGPHGTQPNAAHPGSRALRPTGPTLAEAGIPAASAPKSRVAPNARARGFATRSSTAAIRKSAGPSRNVPSTVIPSRRGGGDNPWIGGPIPIQRGASPRVPSGDLSSRGAPVFNNDARVTPTPGLPSPRFSPPPPSSHLAPATPRFSPPPSSTPRFSPPPSSTPRFSPPPSSTPRFSPPPSSTPRFSPPSSTPRFSPPPSSSPRPSFSTPSFRSPSPSAPSVRSPSNTSRPSTPSFGGSRGGSRGGRR
jgi:hypothetical protein